MTIGMCGRSSKYGNLQSIIFSPHNISRHDTIGIKSFIYGFFFRIHGVISVRYNFAVNNRYRFPGMFFLNRFGNLRYSYHMPIVL